MSELKKAPSPPIIGFVTTAVEGQYDNMLLSGINDTVQEAGATLLCFVGNRLTSAADFTEQGNQVFELATPNIDGLIFTDGISKENSTETIAQFLQQQDPLPTVTIAFQINSHPCVKTDNGSGIQSAIHHLIHHHGHRHIAFIGGPQAHQDAKERYNAYLSGLAEHDIPVDTNLITNGNFFLTSGREAMQELLARDVPIDAVIAANDYMALGAWQVLEEVGIKVPEEIAIVGFDNIDSSRHPQHPLTTIDQPIYKRARLAALALLDLLQDKLVSSEIVVPTELVIRQSCGCRIEETYKYKINKDDKPEKIEPEQVIAGMVQAAHPIPTLRARSWCQDLYHSFMHDLTEPQTQTFLPALHEILEESVYFGGDAKIWHRVLSAFRDSLSPTLSQTENSQQAENLWYQARIQIGLTMAQIQAHLRADREEVAELLRDLDAVFWRTTELSQLFDVIQTQFPRLGVKSFYLVLYDEQPLTEQARLVFAYNQTGPLSLPEEGKQFRSRDLLPDNLLSRHLGSVLIIEHFYFKTHSLGFAVFEVEDVKTAVCDDLSRQIGQNIQRILTLQKQQLTQAQLDERIEAEIKAQQRRAMLENVVRMGQSVTQVADLQECLLRIYKITRESLGFDRVGLHLYDASKHALIGTYGTDRQGSMVEEWDIVMFADENESIRQLLLEPDRLLYTQNYDVEGTAYFPREMDGVKHHASIGSWVGDKPVAVLHVDNLISQRPFTDEQLEGLRFFSGYVGLAIENARLLEQVRDAEQRYRSIFENAVEGIFQIDPEGHFLSVNPAMAHMLGYQSPADLIANITDVRTQVYADPQQRDHLWQELARSGSVQGFEFQVRRQDGNLAWLSQNILIVHDKQGEILHLEGTVQDVTKRKEIETERESLIKELEMRNAELERFTYTVSHDLKSPLVTIQGFMGFVEKDAMAGNIENLKGDIMRINEATSQMYTLLQDLLELSRVGHVVDSSESVPLASLIQEALLLVSGQIEARGVQVVVAQDLPSVYGDRRRLLEVIQNLLDNAVKFMGQQPEPRIEIGAEPDNGMILCYIRDNGIGIQPQYHEKVFGLFDRLDPSIDGSGIGLALVERIIEVHNGRIWVESNGENDGTSLYFTLPAGN
jgi:PAS domain S-box-containing protein